MILQDAVNPDALRAEVVALEERQALVGPGRGTSIHLPSEKPLVSYSRREKVLWEGGRIEAATDLFRVFGVQHFPYSLQFGL